MTCLSRLFRKKKVEPVKKPDESFLDGHIAMARNENSRAAMLFAEASQRHEQTAIEARQVITQVLQRVENLKAAPYASAKK